MQMRLTKTALVDTRRANPSESFRIFGFLILFKISPVNSVFNQYVKEKTRESAELLAGLVV
jgi:hypothetical protein